MNSLAFAAGQWQYFGQGEDPILFPTPDHWASHFPDCGGLMQSPIDIQVNPLIPNPGPWTIDAIHFKGDDVIAENNGHTVQVNPDRSITIGENGVETDYRLLQFHFHTLSEHTFNGSHGPHQGDDYMEMHFVTQATDGSGKLTVLGVLIRPDKKKNKNLDQVFMNLPAAHTEILTVLADNYEVLLPANRSFYSYSGSLTTPPCSEIVNWIVFHEPIKMSFQQVQNFRDLFINHSTGLLFDTNRPTQALNGRTVFNNPIIP